MRKTEITRECNIKEPFISSNLIFECVDLGGFLIDILKAQSSKSDFKHLVIVIPGNPGIVKFYSIFIEELHKKLQYSVPVWVVSHSCHSLHKSAKKNNSISQPLEMEIEHKLRFLEQHIPKKCSKITLIGHSIGCYMILAVLEILAGTRSRRRFTYLSAPINETCTVNKRKDLLRRVEKCYFLFPTIERMKETPNGKRLWPVLNYLQWVAVIIISVLSWLPHPLKIHIASVVLGSKSTNSLMLNAVVELFTGKMFGNMMHLAHDELSNVNQLNSDSIDLMKDKLVIYYGASDKWCPLSYRSDLLKIIPDIETYIDTNNIDHAFVLSHSSTMSSVLVQIMSS